MPRIAGRGAGLSQEQSFLEVRAFLLVTDHHRPPAVLGEHDIA